MLSQIQKVMPQVKNIVFLMFENRSFDNVLGWLYENDSPKHVIPPGSVRKYGSYDGLQTGTYSAGMLGCRTSVDPPQNTRMPMSLGLELL